MHCRRFTIPAALSLVLLLVVLTLWVASYFRGDQLNHRSHAPGLNEQRQLSLTTMWGSLSLSRSGWSASAPHENGFSHSRRHHRPGYDMEGTFGFSYRRITAPGRWLWEIRVPIWPLALLLAIPPTLSLKRHLRSRRDAATGRCAQCGYDLRPSHTRCPECGTPIRGPTPV